MNKNNENKLQSDLRDFIKSTDKFIFSYTGHKSHGKSETVKNILKEIEQTAPIIWSNLLCAHENMVIEQIPLIVDQLKEHDLFEIISDESKGDKSEDSIFDYLDNVHNIQALIDTLRRGLNRKKNGKCLIILDNAENIFGRHLVTSKNKLEKEFFSHWNLFLKEIIELNNSNFSFKIIIISNEKIFPFPELEDYIENFSSIESPRNSSSSLPKFVQQFFQFLTRKFENNGQKMSTSDEIRNSISKLHKDIFNKKNTDQYSFLSEFSNYKFLLDYALINFGYEDELLILFEKENLFLEATANSVRILDYIMKIIPSEMKNYLVYTIDNKESFKYESHESFLNSYSEGIQSYIRDCREKTNLFQKETNLFQEETSFIQLEFSLYKWIKTLDNLDAQHPHDSYYYQLGIILCCPTHNHMFHDIAILLQQHGYTSHFQEALNDVIKRLANLPQLPLRVKVRMKILEGNMYYYNYPENYLRALKCYVEALEEFNREKNPSGHKCGHKCCAMMKTLIFYEIVSTIYQILIGNLYQYFSFTEKLALNCIFKQLRNQLSWRLQFYPMEFPVGNIARENSLLRKHSQFLLKYLINHLSNLGYPPFAEEKDIKCWGIMLNPNYISKPKQDKGSQKYNPPTKNQRYAAAFLKNIEILKINGIALLKLVQKLNIVLVENKKGIKIHWYTLQALYIKSWGSYILDVLSAKKTIKSKLLFSRFNHAFSYLNLFNSTITKINPLKNFVDIEFYWDFLIRFHMLDLLVKDLRRFIKKYQRMGLLELQYSRYYYKDIPKIQEEFSASINKLNAAITELSKELLGHTETKPNKEPVDQNQKTWRLARTYELLGDTGRLEVKFHEIHGQKNKIETLKTILEHYNRARDRYSRIDAHNPYARIQEKITSIKLKIDSVKAVV